MMRLVDDMNVDAVSAALPQRPYYAFLASHEAMARLLQAVTPRLHCALAASKLEWYVLSLLSQVSDRVGGDYVRSVIHEAAMNSRAFVASTSDELHFLYCVSWHDPDYLAPLASLTRTSMDDAWNATCRLVERAFQHRSADLLSLAIERLSFYSPAVWDNTHPILEYYVALARHRQLLGKPVDAERLVLQINDMGDVHHKQIFLHEVCSFLPLKPHEVCVLARSAYGGNDATPPDGGASAPLGTGQHT
jgi:hypothetical protein